MESERQATTPVVAFGRFAYFIGRDRRRQAVGVEQWVVEEREGEQVRRRRRLPSEQLARARVASWRNLRQATEESAF